MKPELQLRNGNKSVDIYNRGMHYSLEHYEDGLWRMVKIARDINEAKVIAEQYVGGNKPTLLNENA